jgi:peptidoglycan/LPS O-acetylase OafA/YrhL
MKYFMGLDWFTQSILATIALMLVWPAIGFFKKNFDVSPSVFVVWYFLGVAIACTFLRDSPFEVFAPGTYSIVAILAIGLLIGGLANMLAFNAVAVAPNPGIPTALFGVASIGVFFISIICYNIWPTYFDKATFDWQSFIGVTLSLAGVAILAIKR